jgi:tRNA nucleotidyltransferase/poly(A) polymerase
MFGMKRRLNLLKFAPVPEGYLVGGAVRDAMLGRDV